MALCFAVTASATAYFSEYGRRQVKLFPGKDSTMPFAVATAGGFRETQHLHMLKEMNSLCLFFVQTVKAKCAVIPATFIGKTQRNKSGMCTIQS